MVHGAESMEKRLRTEGRSRYSEVRDERSDIRSRRAEDTQVKYASLVISVPQLNRKERFNGIKISPRWNKGKNRFHPSTIYRTYGINWAGGVKRTEIVECE